MIKDFFEDTKADINNTIRQYAGLDIPEETAKQRLMEINSVIFEEEAEQTIRLKDFLKLYYSNFQRTGILGLDEASNSAFPVWIYPEADNYHQEEEYPLIFKEPLLQKKEYRLKIDNLRRFLADYQRQTGSWISTDEIMDAGITYIKMHGFGQYSETRLEIYIKLN